MTKKLAIVISGAVSLGSYEAGVAYEVLEAIAQHNEAAPPEDKIIIDVITGASAGGITAAVLGKALLCHGKKLREAYANPLYKAWVEKVKMVKASPADPEEGLLEVEVDNHKYSLLNMTALNHIAEGIFPDDFLQCANDCEISEPHPAANKDNGVHQVAVGIAMGNLNGFPLDLQLNIGTNLKSNARFAYSQYKDNFVLKMKRPTQEPIEDVALEEWEQYTSKESPLQMVWKPRKGLMSVVSWSQLREVALSSGAFPFAFGVRQIERHSDQGDDSTDNPTAVYASRDSTRKAKAFQAEDKSEDPFNGKYVYTDGGVFENEPVGLAISLIDSLYPDGHQATDKDRYFLFIAPGARKASSDPFRTINRDEKGAQPDHLAVAKALASAIMGQSRFQQWITRADKPKVLAITSEDGTLLGDVFSAFGGFLDEKFRAYDYNIGRQTAQRKLEALRSTSNTPIKNFKCQPPAWPPTRRPELRLPSGLNRAC